VRAAIQTGDAGGAEQAVQRLLATYPENSFTGRSALLYGQALNRLAHPADARKFFAEFLERFPQSASRPAIELAVARTYELEGNWKEAVTRYDSWVRDHSSHESLPRAEFDRAWGHHRLGDDADAFKLFTNYVVQFALAPEAALAQSWIARYFYSQERYDAAELNFRKVYQNTNWPQSDLTFQAKMMAGRSAFSRQGYADAIGYFTNLINDAACPQALLPEAYFALADTFVRYPEAVGPTTNSLGHFTEAIAALSKITQIYTNSPQAPLAWGRIGDCYRQLATQDAKFYVRAANAYVEAIKSERANLSARSLAQIGLAQVLEKQAEKSAGPEQPRLLTEALGHYLSVLHGKNLRPGEQADPSAVKDAAVAAARLSEEQGRWDMAANLYRQLVELLPPLRKNWEAKLERLQHLRSMRESKEK
jgi:TolA-binding protein